MNLLVGATGLIGGHLVEYLFQQGEISKGTFRMGSHLKIMDGAGVQGLEVDLLDHHSLHEAMEGVDCVYNLASPPPGGTDYRANTEGLLNLLEVAVESKVKSFVHLSTLEVHGFRAGEVSASSPLSPSNEYQKSKAEAERLLLEFSKRNQTPRVVTIRAARAFGSRDTALVAPLVRMIESKKVVLPGTGSMSYSHPLDVSQAMYKAALGTTPSGGVFLIKSFDASPEELARHLSASLGVEPSIKRSGVFSKAPLPEYTSEQLQSQLRIGPQASWKELGYEPQLDLPKSCEEIAKWYKKEPWAVEAD